MSENDKSVFENEELMQALYTELSDVLIQQRIKEKRKLWGKEPYSPLRVSFR